MPVKQADDRVVRPEDHRVLRRTEANGFTFCTAEEWLAHPGTVGKRILGELLILDDDGNDGADRHTGTVWFEGATNFEYYHDADKTAEAATRPGDARTVGDVGYSTRTATCTSPTARRT